ncbi:MAG: helix-turn-helix domain-containing protein [Thaumarchaeota archaeon]|nr:helix-turn-helix domain-containing protein [Nitrososphaerota archaeon]MCL5318753.1 helix-turn-helix domain-containing protein [Nitrososphaerota archaeon]
MSESPGSSPYNISIEIVNERCKVLALLKDLGINEFRMMDVRGSEKGVTCHLVKMSSRQIEKIPKDNFTKKHSDYPDEDLAWFDTDGCDVCNTIVSNGSFLVSGRDIQNQTFIYTFIAPNFEAYRSIISGLESKGLKPKVLKIERYEAKGRILTEKQERVLWLALKMGFFDYPRKINSVEFAKKVGVEPSTLSEITRRGMRRLLEHYFESQ